MARPELADDNSGHQHDEPDNQEPVHGNHRDVTFQRSSVDSAGTTSYRRSSTGFGSSRSKIASRSAARRRPAARGSSSATPSAGMASAICLLSVEPTMMAPFLWGRSWHGMSRL